MKKANLFLLVILGRSGFIVAQGIGSAPAAESWYFAVSGDSRNCGDVVMPAIAADARKHRVQFYWHLGDLRAISFPDQDFLEAKRRQDQPADLAVYEKEAWDDFLANQVKPWGDVPFYLGIGNHETAAPKTRAEFVERFHDYLDRPELKEQRLKDDQNAQEPRTYYHWMRDGIDFINLDNATSNQFDAAQMKWLEGVLRRDRQDGSIRTIVVGMHKALPESISVNHSMNESPAGVASGRRVYHWLLDVENEAHQRVYVLASHSHYFMDGTYNTAYWRANGGVLPGWIIGTAGAERYPLPSAAGDAGAAETNTYGYLIATVNPSGQAPGAIQFKFEELKENSIPKDVKARFSDTFVHQCFIANRRSIPVR